MIYHFVLNPMSGKSLKAAKKTVEEMTEKIRKACQKRQLSYRIYYTTSVGDATEYVRSMINTTQDRQRFICVGGDGTINEIVNSAPSLPNIEFGVIPNGSGNDFVRNFTNTELFSDIDAQIDGAPMALDLIKWNDSYCVNMINIGFDCSVVKEASRLKRFKFISPGLSYLFGVFIAVFKKYGTKMKLIFDDGEVIDTTLLLTAIANGRFCGGGFNSNPEALLDDGIIDLAIIKKVSRFTFMGLLGAYKKGTYLSNKRAQKYITYKRVSHFKMEFDGPIPICVDGEIKGAKTIDFSVERKALNFVIPKGSGIRYSNEADSEDANEAVADAKDTQVADVNETVADAKDTQLADENGIFMSGTTEE
ncbi:MAG: YegS/Rv2252/BmrU family lipid kinase [Clostridia bacterium]|nr:YegS/Rv2252/BmrU family lipid kinase [Clostridia bacterium]